MRLWGLGTRKGPGLPAWPPPGKHCLGTEVLAVLSGFWRRPLQTGHDSATCSYGGWLPLSQSIHSDANVHFFVYFYFFYCWFHLKTTLLHFCSVSYICHLFIVLTACYYCIYQKPYIFCSYERRKTIEVFFKWKWKHQNTEFRQNQMQQEWLSNLNKAFSLWLCLWL